VIEEVPLSTFAKDRKVRLKDHPKRLHDGKESVRRARQRIGEKKYNLVFNNCEHFVMWCIQGKHSSEQVNRLVREAGLIAAQLKLIADLKTAERTIPVASQLLVDRRLLSKAANTVAPVQASASLSPLASTTFNSVKVARSMAPIAGGLSTAGLTSVMGGAGATALGIVSAPVSAPVLAVTAGIGITVIAASALWDTIFD